MRFINRKNNEFDERVTDEINKKISNLYNLIQNYKPAILQYKYNVLPITISGAEINNSSFQIGKLYVINFEYTGSFVSKDFFKIGKIGKTFDTDLYIIGAGEYNPIIKITRTGNIFIKGVNKSSSIYCYYTYIQGN